MPVREEVYVLPEEYVNKVFEIVFNRSNVNSFRPEYELLNIYFREEPKIESGSIDLSSFSARKRRRRIEAAHY